MNLRDFDFLIEKVRTNYAGWDTKVTETSRPALDALTTKLRADAADASPEEFTMILQKWAAFFDDGHLTINARVAPAPNGTAVYPAIDWNEDYVRRTIEARGANRDPIEGIWKIGGGRYRVGVLPMPDAPGKYAAVVLTTTVENWAPGQIKAELTKAAAGEIAMLFRSGNHAEHRTNAELAVDDTALRVMNWGNWIREVPAIQDQDRINRELASGELFFKPLSAKTLWLRIPSFDPSFAEALKNAIAANTAALATYPNLVIDLRENGGGDDWVYEPLIELIYTRPIYAIGVEMRASEDNIALRRAVADRLRKDSPETADYVDRELARMAANIGQYVPSSDETVSIQRLLSVRAFPKRVAVLIDGSGSTAEQFLLAARQSRKVTLFGQENSAGVLDFANAVRMPSPSGRYEVFWATSRSMRLPDDPVDPDGIAPDIRIPRDVSDTVRFAQNWLERQVD